MELRGSKVQLTCPHENFINGVANPEIVYLDTWVLFNLILGKNKDFQSGALLKISLSSPSMEEFGLDIQK